VLTLIVAANDQPSVNRLAVAFTLIVEGPWTLLILAQHPALRRLSAAMQTLIQIAIALTGNYNFFNLLTVVVACTLLDVEHAVTPRFKGETPLILKNGALSRGYARWIACGASFQTHRGVSVVVLDAGMAF